MEKIPFISTQNCVYKLECADRDAFYIGVLSREISTRVKKHLRYTKKPPNRPMKLERFQMRSPIAVHAIFYNYQGDTENIKVI